MEPSNYSPLHAIILSSWSIRKSENEIHFFFLSRLCHSLKWDICSHFILSKFEIHYTTQRGKYSEKDKRISKPIAFVVMFWLSRKDPKFFIHDFNGSIMKRKIINIHQLYFNIILHWLSLLCIFTPKKRNRLEVFYIKALRKNNFILFCFNFVLKSI